jgi:hypothetical protein
MLKLERKTVKYKFKLTAVAIGERPRSWRHPENGREKPPSS